MIRSAFSLALLVVGLAACGTPFEHHDTRDIPKGGGIFSGPEGAFTISSDKKEKASAARSASSVPDDFREFQDYQDFQRWKASVKDSPEYREFQDWREWKSYRVWKSQQSK